MKKIMKAKRIVGIIKYLSSFLPLKTLAQKYKALVRSHLDNCGTIYHIPALTSQTNLGVTLNSLMEKVERTQYQAVLGITGTRQGSHRSKLYEELGWETISDRRWCRRILQMLKNNMTPSYLKDKLPPNRKLLYRCNNSKTFHEIRCKTSRYTNSFFPDAINSWNNIIRNFQNVPPFTCLKAQILSLIRPKTKSTFGVDDPLGLQYIFQLNGNLSPLRNHKSRQNFADTPSEICECNQDVEDTSHFLFECKVIEILQRNDLYHLGNQLGLYLYGHRSLNLIDNRRNLLSTIKYIKDTQRFSPPLAPISYYYCKNNMFFVVVYCKLLGCHGFGLISLPGLWLCLIL